MTQGIFLQSTAYRLAVQANGLPDADRPRDGGDGSTRQLDWQRALERAQEGGFSGWFGAPALASPAAAGPGPGLESSRSASIRPLFASALSPAVSNAAGRHGEAAGSRQSDITRNDTAPHADTDDPQGMPATAARRGTDRTSSLAQLAAAAAYVSARSFVPTTSMVDVSVGLGVAGGGTSASLQTAVAGAVVGSPLAAATDATEDAEAETASGRSASSGRSGSVAQRSDQDDAVRLYAEWSEQGVRIWLGADAALQLPVDALALQLQRLLAASGERLLALMCNGREVWADRTPDAAAQKPATLRPASDLFASRPLFSDIPYPYSQEIP